MVIYVKSAVICHGDCDGVISSFLYIKHYLRDAYPSNVSIVFTQPWRAHVDLRKIPKESREVVMLDIALNNDVVNYLLGMIGPNVKMVVIDHHASSEAFIDKLSRAGVKVIWSKSTSTPRLIHEVLKPSINPYEAFLVKVADVCEGVEAPDDEVMRVADLIKLSIARDPSDKEFMNYLIKSMLAGHKIQALDEVIKRASIAKWLLNKLLKQLTSKSVVVGNYLVTTLTASESRIYAGLLGVASTELSRETKSDIILVREEEGKVVITVRSNKREALTICKLVAEKLNGKYGGHPEAASATLSNKSLIEVQQAVLEVIRSVRRAIT